MNVHYHKMIAGLLAGLVQVSALNAVPIMLNTWRNDQGKTIALIGERHDSATVYSSTDVRARYERCMAEQLCHMRTGFKNVSVLLEIPVAYKEDMFNPKGKQNVLSKIIDYQSGATADLTQTISYGLPIMGLKAKLQFIAGYFGEFLERVSFNPVDIRPRLVQALLDPVLKARAIIQKRKEALTLNDPRILKDHIDMTLLFRPMPADTTGILTFGDFVKGVAEIVNATESMPEYHLDIVEYYDYLVSVSHKYPDDMPMRYVLAQESIGFLNKVYDYLLIRAFDAGALVHIRTALESNDIIVLLAGVKHGVNITQYIDRSMPEFKSLHKIGIQTQEDLQAVLQQSAPCPVVSPARFGAWIKEVLPENLTAYCSRLAKRDCSLCLNDNIIESAERIGETALVPHLRECGFE